MDLHQKSIEELEQLIADIERNGPAKDGTTQHAALTKLKQQLEKKEISNTFCL